MGRIRRCDGEKHAYGGGGGVFRSTTAGKLAIPQCDDVFCVTTGRTLHHFMGSQAHHRSSPTPKSQMASQKQSFTLSISCKHFINNDHQETFDLMKVYGPDMIRYNFIASFIRDGPIIGADIQHFSSYECRVCESDRLQESNNSLSKNTNLYLRSNQKLK